MTVSGKKVSSMNLKFTRTLKKLALINGVFDLYADIVSHEYGKNSSSRKTAHA